MEAKPIGIANVGNTCYLNTALQCLAHAPIFVETVNGMIVKGTARSSHLLCELNEMLMQMTLPSSARGACVEPRKFIACLAANLQKKGMYVFEQNDMHEFLGCMLEALNASVCGCVPAEYIARIDRAMAKTEKTRETLIARFLLASEKAWYQSHAKDWSPLVGCCYGQLAMQTKCDHCGEINHVHEPCLGMTLALTQSIDRWGNEESVTLDELIKNYMASEHVEGYVCDSAICRSAQRLGHRCIRISRKPDVLMFFLKRFDDKGSKIDTRVSVPEELCIDNHCIRTKNSANHIYRLVSIGCHTGSTAHSGHYFAVCRKGEQWFKIDDDDVTSLPTYSVVSSRVFYALVYQVVN